MYSMMCQAMGGEAESWLSLEWKEEMAEELALGLSAWMKSP